MAARLKVPCLLLLIAGGLLFIVASFDARLRFADPNPAQEANAFRNYHCYHDRLYTDQHPTDAYLFGASRTFFAARPSQVNAAYETITSQPLDTMVFAPRWPNPEIAYFFFREYLQRNKAPKVALFELTSNMPLHPPVTYMHPLFPNLAPPYLYADLARSWEFVHHHLFALADTLRLGIRHLDLSLSNLLVASHDFIVPAGDNCAADTAAVSRNTSSAKARLAQSYNNADSLEALLEMEAQALLPEGGWEMAGDHALLTRIYQGQPQQLYRLGLFGPGWSKKPSEEPWVGGDTRAKSLHYYRQIVAMAREADVPVAFYIVPQLYSPQAPTEALDALSNELGAPVHIIPFRYARVGYHHYRDMTHLNPEAAPLYAAWFAGIIQEALGD